MTFLDPVAWRSLCEEYLSTVEVSIPGVVLIFSPTGFNPLYRFHLNSQIKQFKDAIEDDFFFEMLIDDLPVWGYIGEVNTQKHR